MTHTLKNIWEATREYVVSVPSETTFQTSGRLIPQEFVTAGDYLTYKFPTWSWESGIRSKHKSYLPDDKQYLMTRHVPVKLENLVVTSEWTEISEDGIADFADFETLILENNDKSELTDIPDLQTESEDHCNTIVPTRTYDIAITYDKYYQTPRIWLTGFDENGLPLTAEQMYADISDVHLGKTVTVESHPHEDGIWLTVHPCKHASVMKKLYKQKEEYTAEHYMVLFLKFMTSVLYHIDYDNSMDF